MNNFGNEEGEMCWRNGCQGVISIIDIEGCSCHINPPCGACTSPREYCPVCGWLAEDDEDITYIPMIPNQLGEVVKGPYPRPLDPRKIDYHVLSHTSSSQICEGVYPEGTTKEDVESRVRGTFGGRFERFGGGKFKYVAYTD